MRYDRLRMSAAFGMLALLLIGCSNEVAPEIHRAPAPRLQMVNIDATTRINSYWWTEIDSTVAGPWDILTGCVDGPYTVVTDYPPYNPNVQGFPTNNVFTPLKGAWDVIYPNPTEVPQTTMYLGPGLKKKFKSQLLTRYERDVIYAWIEVKNGQGNWVSANPSVSSVIESTHQFRYTDYTFDGTGC